jgi:hypothetical protein
LSWRKWSSEKAAEGVVALQSNDDIDIAVSLGLVTGITSDQPEPGNPETLLEFVFMLPEERQNLLSVLFRHGQPRLR